MAYSIIRLQEAITLNVAGATGGPPPSIWAVYRQPASQAVNVAPYYYVTPWLRVLQDPDNSVTASGANPLRFKFYSSVPPALVQEQILTNLTSPPSTPSAPASASVSTTTVDEFVDCGDNSGAGAIIDVDTTISSNSAGFMKTMAWTSSFRGFEAITNPGGLMIYEVQNRNSASATIRFEIYLVCRGLG